MQNICHLKPLNSDANSEEDTDSETDVAATLSQQVEEVKDRVISPKGNGNNKKVADKK